MANERTGLFCPSCSGVVAWKAINFTESFPCPVCGEQIHVPKSYGRTIGGCRLGAYIDCLLFSGGARRNTGDSHCRSILSYVVRLGVLDQAVAPTRARD